MNIAKSHRPEGLFRGVLFLILFIAFCMPAARLKAQTPGTLDPSFDAGTGSVNFAVTATASLSGGKVLIGGEFTLVRGAERNRVARLNADGTADETFDPGTGANDTVHSLAVQSDGKVLIGGLFSSFNETVRNRIARLNGDGSLDTSFDPGTGVGGRVFSVVVQGDGKVLIGGDFTSFNGTARNYIARLNSDGTLDTSFDPGIGTDGSIYSVAVQGDGKVLIGGWFTSFNGTARNYIARLNSDGSLDTSFDPGTGGDGIIYSLAAQSDGKVLIGGGFAIFNGTARCGIARLNADGTLDTSFDPGTGTSGTVSSVAVQSDGKVLIGGGFAQYNNTQRNCVARLNPEGSLDTSFDPGMGTTASGAVASIAVQSDGKLLIGGMFTSYNGEAASRIARLDPDGDFDGSFNPGSGANRPYVHAIAVQSDGKVLIGGDFTSFNGTARNRIARLNADGSLDTSFDPGTGAGGTVYSLVMQSDGKVLIGGAFEVVGGRARYGIARLNADGSLDRSFSPGPGADGPVHSVAVLSDGKVLIGGAFNRFNNTTCRYIARLNADGSLDTSFDPGSGATSTIYSVTVQSDGKVLVGGSFGGFNGTGRRSIARLNADGSLDTGFDPGTGADTGFVKSVTVQSDGKVLIGGSFTRFDGMIRNRIARLNADGSLDTSFDPGTGGSGDVNSLAVQSDEKVLIGGSFTSINGAIHNRLARLNPDGTLDTSFDPGRGANGWIFSLAVQGDGKVLIGGGFTSVNGATRSYLTRLQNDPAIQSLTAPDSNRVQWLRGGTSPEVQDVSFELSTDSGGSWSLLGMGTRISGGWELTGLNLPISGQIRARGRTSGGSFNGSSGLVETVQAYIPASIPVATSGTASNITRTSADLSGTVNPKGAETTVIFQTRRGTEAYTSAGNVTAAQSPVPAGTEPVAVSATKTGLLPGTTYEFNIASSNSVGAGEWSQSVSFTTLPNAAPVAAERQIAAPPVGVPTVIFDVGQHASDADGDPLIVSILDGASAFGSATTDGKTVTFTSSALVRSVTVQLEVGDGFITVPVTVTLTLADPVRSTIANKGGAVPGAGEDPRIPAGSVWASFGVPSINDSGAVAFLGNVKASPSFSGIFAGKPSALALLARKGLVAPGTDGAFFASFRDPLLSNAGEVAFLGTLTGSGVRSSNKQGIWRAVPAQNGEGYALELVARAGDETPGVPGAKWKSFISVLLHGDAADPASRSVVALATLVTGPGGVAASSDRGLWRFDENGGRLLLREGQMLEVRGVATKVRSFIALSSASGSPGHGRVSEAQGALIRAKLADGRSALLKADASSLSVLAVTGEEIEPGVLLASLGFPGGDFEGATVAKVVLEGQGITSANKTAIALFSKEVAEGLIYRTGMDTSSSGVPQVKSFLDPVANHEGAAFVATLTGAGVTGDTNTALLWQDNDSLKLLAREGAEPVGVDGAKWASFTSLVLPDGSGPLFTAKLRVGPGSVTTTGDVGLWGVDSAGTLRLLIREGESSEAGILKKFTILSAVSGSPAQRRSYNAHGALIYRAYFTDKSQALIQVQLP